MTLKAAVLFAFVTVLLCSTQCQLSLAKTFRDLYTVDEDAFETWMWTALEKYPEWVLQNNLDPSPIIQGPVNISVNTCILQLNGDIKNFNVRGYTENMTVTGTFADTPLFRFALENGYNTTPATIIFEGEYTVNGTVISSIPISGSGKWRLSYANMRHVGFVYNYTVTPEGYLQLSSDPGDLHYFADLPDVAVEIEFEGLLDGGAGGYEEQVKEILSKKLRDVFGPYDYGQTSIFPGATVLFQYLTEIFQETPWADIISTPITTTTPRPSTTTGLPTTSGPCEDFNVIEQANQDITLSKEMVTMLTKNFPELKFKLLPGTQYVVKAADNTLGYNFKK